MTYAAPEHYDDVADSTIYFDDLPTSVGASRPGPYSCQCNPTTGASCRECDGTAAANADFWRVRADLRKRLAVANLRIDAAYRARYGPDRGQAAAQADLNAVLDEIERWRLRVAARDGRPA